MAYHINTGLSYHRHRLSFHISHWTLNLADINSDQSQLKVNLLQDGRLAPPLYTHVCSYYAGYLDSYPYSTIGDRFIRWNQACGSHGLHVSVFSRYKWQIVE